MLVDSHCHLCFEDFSIDMEEVLLRAQSLGITRFLNICCKLEEIERLQAFSKVHEGVYFSVGIHPHEATVTLEKEPFLKEALRKALDSEGVVALGETGLDFYYTHGRPQDQEAAFRVHCELALEHQVPLVIHSRDAEKETLKILDAYPGVRGVFHCFTGSSWLAMEALARGFYLSVSGILTFKGAEDLRMTIKEAPLERLLVETDAPYLAPVPYRGKRNEPAFVMETAKKLAEVKEVSLEDVAFVTTQNFFNLFTRAER